MTNKDNWIEQLRAQMDGFEETAPDGLWHDIQAALQEEPNQKRHALIIPLRRWAVAASIASALLGGALLYWNKETPKPKPNNLTATSEQAESVDDSAASESFDSTAEGKPLLAQAEKTRCVQQETSYVSPSEKLYERNCSAQQPSVQASELISSEKNNSTDDNQSVTVKESSPVESAPEKMQMKEQCEQRNEKEILEALAYYKTDTRKESSRFGMGLYAANDLIGIRNTSAVVNYTMAGRFYGFDTEDDASIKTLVKNYTEKTKHYQPYSIGLTGRWGFADRWSLSTGLVYTRLRSDFTNSMGSTSITQKQTLHYVGLPVNIMYQIWGNRHFSIYAATGGQADLNFKATMETEGVSKNIDKDNVQWSINAGVGAQYNFIPSLGIYLEPGVKYYFDNGSSLENTFKDKQCNFNLQFGIRYNMGE